MEVPKIYLETTMFSFYYGQETTPEYRQYKAEARAVFDLIKAGEYEPYTSLYAIGEIDDETAAKYAELDRGLRHQGSGAHRRNRMACGSLHQRKSRPGITPPRTQPILRLPPSTV
jgi:hypothetical protein